MCNLILQLVQFLFFLNHVTEDRYVMSTPHPIRNGLLQIPNHSLLAKLLHLARPELGLRLSKYATTIQAAQ
jgi:hypothetical protein